MCQGFGTIVTKNLDVYFTMFDDSGDIHHSNIIEALGIDENDNQFLRNFVRTENPDWTEESFHFDENDTLPGWVDEVIVKDKVNRLLEKVSPIWAEYLKVRQSAWAEYEKVRRSAWAEYEKVQLAAWAEYEKVEQSARKQAQKKLRKISGYVEVK